MLVQPSCSLGTTGAKNAAHARGNSAETIVSLLRCPVRFWEATGATRCDVGERTLPERTGLRPGGPLAPGGVSGGCGAKGAA